MTDTVLYIDNDYLRQSIITKQIVENSQLNVVPVGCILQVDYEMTECKYVLLHRGNQDEATGIFSGDWKGKGEVVLLFSGELVNDNLVKVRHGFYRISANALSKDPNSILRQLKIK